MRWAEAVRGALEDAGAESIDRAREMWWDSQKTNCTFIEDALRQGRSVVVAIGDDAAVFPPPDRPKNTWRHWQLEQNRC